MIYSEKLIKEIEYAAISVTSQYVDILSIFSNTRWKTERIYEFAMHGFLRRLRTLRSCIFNIFEICPIRNLKRIGDEEKESLTISLQAFYINIYGALENLAWIWVLNYHNKNGETSDPSPKQIGFNKKYKLFRKSCSLKIIEKLDAYEVWYNGIENFRHALAHRIPLYVPPAGHNEDERRRYNELVERINIALLDGNRGEVRKLQASMGKIGKFIPVIKHSWGENSDEIYFHRQIIVDWKTVRELALLFIEEIELLNSTN